MSDGQGAYPLSGPVEASVDCPRGGVSSWNPWSHTKSQYVSVLVEPDEVQRRRERSVRDRDRTEGRRSLCAINEEAQQQFTCGAAASYRS